MAAASIRLTGHTGQTQILQNNHSSFDPGQKRNTDSKSPMKSTGLTENHSLESFRHREPQQNFQPAKVKANSLSFAQYSEGRI